MGRHLDGAHPHRRQRLDGRIRDSVQDHRLQPGPSGLGLQHLALPRPRPGDLPVGFSLAGCEAQPDGEGRPHLRPGGAVAGRRPRRETLRHSLASPATSAAPTRFRPPATAARTYSIGSPRTSFPARRSIRISRRRRSTPARSTSRAFPCSFRRNAVSSWKTQAFSSLREVERTRGGRKTSTGAICSPSFRAASDWWPGMKSPCTRARN